MNPPMQNTLVLTACLMLSACVTTPNYKSATKTETNKTITRLRSLEGTIKDIGGNHKSLDILLGSGKTVDVKVSDKVSANEWAKLHIGDHITFDLTETSEIYHTNVPTEDRLADGNWERLRNNPVAEEHEVSWTDDIDVHAHIVTIDLKNRKLTVTSVSDERKIIVSAPESVDLGDFNPGDLITIRYKEIGNIHVIP
jgi:hypothetical protein